jgi:hypothetical protein
MCRISSALNTSIFIVVGRCHLKLCVLLNNWLLSINFKGRRGCLMLLWSSGEFSGRSYSTLPDQKNWRNIKWMFYCVTQQRHIIIIIIIINIKTLWSFGYYSNILWDGFILMLPIVWATKSTRRFGGCVLWWNKKVPTERKTEAS